MARKGLSRKQKERWFFIRYDTLLLEGFSPEEAALVSLTKISSPQMRRLRRSRKRVLAQYTEAGYDRREAIQATREHFLERGQDVISWQDLREFLYSNRKRHE